MSELAPLAVPGGSAEFPTKIVEVCLRVENRTAGTRERSEWLLRPGMTRLCISFAHHPSSVAKIGGQFGAEMK